MGSHALDIIDHIIGPLQEVSGTAGNLGSTAPVEDVVAMSFRAGCGVPGAAQWNFASAEPADVLEFRGTEGAVTLSVFGAEAPVLHRGGRRFTLHPPPAPQHVQQPLIQAVVEDLRGHGACLSTGMTARRTSKVMDDVLAGYYGGREDAYWSRPETWPGRVTHPRH
jgi:predicted dehydrogenase